MFIATKASQAAQIRDAKNFLASNLSFSQWAASKSPGVARRAARGLDLLNVARPSAAPVAQAPPPTPISVKIARKNLPATVTPKPSPQKTALKPTVKPAQTLPIIQKPSRIRGSSGRFVKSSGTRSGTSRTHPGKGFTISKGGPKTFATQIMQWKYAKPRTTKQLFSDLVKNLQKPPITFKWVRIKGFLTNTSGQLRNVTTAYFHTTAEALAFLEDRDNHSKSPIGKSMEVNLEFEFMS